MCENKFIVLTKLSFFMHKNLKFCSLGSSGPGTRLNAKIAGVHAGLPHRALGQVSFLSSMHLLRVRRTSSLLKGVASWHVTEPHVG